MAIHADLQAILNQAAGTYFLYYDRSIVPEVVSASGLRILVGQSKQGPVNALTYHDSWTSFKNLYGDVDAALMRRGSYFHLSAFTMLQTGIPLAAVNLRPFEDDTDVAGKVELASETDKSNTSVSEFAYRNLFNRQRFWKPQFENVVDTSNLDNLISIVNGGDSKLSIFVRKAAPNNIELRGTIESYYRDTLRKDVPAYLNPSDDIRDTFVDVYVFRNDFSDLVAASANPAYGNLFTSDGIVRRTTNTLGETVDGLEQLTNIVEANYVETYTGSLIPDLVDLSNNTLFIANLINLDYNTTGLVADINYEILDDAALWEPTLDVSDNIVYASNGAKKALPIDLIGHGLQDINASENLDETAYPGQSVEMMSYTYSTTLEAYDVDGYTTLTEDQTDATLLKLTNAKLGGAHVYDEGTGQWTPNGVTTKAIVSSLLGNNNVGDKYVARDGNVATVTDVSFLGVGRELLDFHTSALPIYDDGGTNTVFPTDTAGVFVYPTGHPDAGQPVEYDPVTDAPLDGVGGTVIPTPTLTAGERTTILASNGTDINLFELSFDREILHQNATLTGAAGDQATMPNAFYQLSNGQYIQWFNDGSNGVLFKVASPEDVVDTYKPFVLKNYKQRSEQFVNGTASRQNTILNVILDDLKEGFKDIERVDFRYLVDSFDTYIEPNAKQQLTAVMRERGVGAALINGPSIKKLANSTDPYFRETPDGQFSARHLETGGNTELPKTTTFGMGGIGNDKGYAYTPWFNFDYNGTEILYPPAAAVSINFAQKNRTGRQFDAVFGPETGAITVNGIKALEYDLSDSERASFEKVGLNPIVFKKNSGNIVLGNYTLFTQANSALQFAHVNELVTYIHDQMRPIAEFLLGKYNNDQNRLTAKKRMDAVTNGMLAAGVLQYAENIVDTTNNTQEIISEAMAVMDTIIVPGFINTRVVHRLVINRRTDEITSTIL